MAFPLLTRDQMLERCDLAGVARVVSVGRTTVDSPNLAKLVFLKAVKGAPRERGGFVYVRLRGGPTPFVDGVGDLAAWSDWRDYPIGGTIMTHLDWNGPEDLYQTTWPGAAHIIDAEMAKVA
jgi:hypothetical protein